MPLWEKLAIGLSGAFIIILGIVASVIMFVMWKKKNQKFLQIGHKQIKLSLEWRNVKCQMNIKNPRTGKWNEVLLYLGFFFLFGELSVF